MIDFYKINKNNSYVQSVWNLYNNIAIPPETFNCRCILPSDDWYYNIKVEYKKNKINRKKYKGIKFYENIVN